MMTLTNYLSTFNMAEGIENSIKRSKIKLQELEPSCTSWW